jgi:hypothetical protein
MKSFLHARLHQAIVDLGQDPVASDRQGEMAPWGTRRNQMIRQINDYLRAIGDVNEPVSPQAQRQQYKRDSD